MKRLLGVLVYALMLWIAPTLTLPNWFWIMVLVLSVGVLTSVGIWAWLGGRHGT